MKKELSPRQERQANAKPEDKITMQKLDLHVIEIMAKILVPLAREAFADGDIRRDYEKYLEGGKQNK